MKKITLLVCLAALLMAISGQGRAQVTYEKKVLNTNLFNEFVNGTVLMKDGRVEASLLNYDTENQTIVFKQGEQVMILTGLESVDTVMLENRRFVHLEDKFYEVVPGQQPINLFVSYTNKKTPVISSPDHTGVSKQAVSTANNNVAGAYLSRPNQLNYTVSIFNHFWIKRENSLHKADNEKQLLKVIPSKYAPAVKNYIKENSVNFDSQADMSKLLTFCNTQIR